MASASWTEALTLAAEQRFEAIREVRRHLHQYPEQSGMELQTTRYLTSMIAGEGLVAVVTPSGRGLWVDFVSGGRSPGSESVGDSAVRIGVRADIDALRIQDEKQGLIRSQVAGVMHACGHDAHASVGFGVLTTLVNLDRAGQLPWPVACRVLFQPAEETNLGALEMVQAGALEGLTDLLGLHVDPSRAAGTIGIRHGDFTADCHELEIVIHGRGAHAARPHEAVDPIAIAAQLISSIYLFVPRGNDSQDPVVITFGQIEGGHASNVIPDRVTVRGTMRTLDTEVSGATIRHIERLTRGLADASGSKIDVHWHSGPPPVKNDPVLVDLLAESGRAVLGDRQVQTVRRPSMGGEDFANYLPHVRGAMFRLGCVSEPAAAPQLHNPMFDIDERALRVGTEVLVQAVIRWSAPGRLVFPTSLV